MYLFAHKNFYHSPIKKFNKLFSVLVICHGTLPNALFFGPDVKSVSDVPGHLRSNILSLSFLWMLTKLTLDDSADSLITFLVSEKGHNVMHSQQLHMLLVCLLF